MAPSRRRPARRGRRHPAVACEHAKDPPEPVLGLQLNLLLGLFNLIPGAPLDGGRVLRAWLWRRHGDRTRAAFSATRAGTIVGYGFIGLGLLQFIAGASVGGLWLAFIGWFVLGAARAEAEDLATRHALGGVRVRDVMTRGPAMARGWITVDEFVERFVLGNRHSAYPVEGLDGRVSGLVTLAQVRQVRPAASESTRVADIALALGDIAVTAPDESLVALLDRLTRTPADARSCSTTAISSASSHRPTWPERPSDAASMGITT